MNLYNQDTDGINHVNIYSKGKTVLGRLMSNFAHVPVDIDGITFQSIEGYWYWLSTGKGYGHLISLYGYQAKEYGRDLPKVQMSDGEFRCAICRAMRNKVEQCKELRELLAVSTLPFTHYYVMGEKEVDAGFQWIVDYWDILRTELRDGIPVKKPTGPVEEVNGWNPAVFAKGNDSMFKEDVGVLEPGFYTSSLQYSWSDEVNITKTNGSVFAPSWELLKAFKAGRVSSNQYASIYWNEMGAAWREDKAPFKALIAESKERSVVLVCYCRAGTFCHRVLLAKEIFAEKLGCKYHGEIGVVGRSSCPHCGVRLPLQLIAEIERVSRLTLACPNCSKLVQKKQ